MPATRSPEPTPDGVRRVLADLDEQTLGIGDNARRATRSRPPTMTQRRGVRRLAASAATAGESGLSRASASSSVFIASTMPARL